MAVLLFKIGKFLIENWQAIVGWFRLKDDVQELKSRVSAIHRTACPSCTGPMTIVKTEPHSDEFQWSLFRCLDSSCFYGKNLYRLRTRGSTVPIVPAA